MNPAKGVGERLAKIVVVVPNVDERKEGVVELTLELSFDSPFMEVGPCAVGERIFNLGICQGNVSSGANSHSPL